MCSSIENMKIVSDYQADGSIILNMVDNTILRKIRAIVEERFKLPVEEYCSWSRDKFADFAVEVQDEIQALNPQREFLESEYDKITALLGEANICHQSIAFFRVVRPESLTGITEAPDFHRETFYSDSPETTKHMLNIWIPIKNISPNNTMYFIPGSQKIRDEDIQIQVENDLERVEKFSSGHKLGFFWKPKLIKGGANLEGAVPMQFDNKIGEYSAFSALTIHGGARNLSNTLRFVIGFGLIAESKIYDNKSFFASGQSYFKKYRHLEKI